MFGISLLEVLVIAVIALLVFGPEKLPEMARVLGKLSGELKKNTDSIRREFYNTIYEPAKELNSRVEQEKRSLVSSVKDLSPLSDQTPPREAQQTTNSPQDRKDESETEPGSPS
jgi:sec-independent protein translocase protein TatB